MEKLLGKEIYLISVKSEDQMADVMKKDFQR
jgi:hypothetical protein